MNNGARVELSKESGSKFSGKRFKTASFFNGKANLNKNGKVVLIGMDVKYLRVL